MINKTAIVGRGRVPAVRTTADGTGRTCLYEVGGSYTNAFCETEDGTGGICLYAVGSSYTGGDMSPPYKRLLISITN